MSDQCPRIDAQLALRLGCGIQGGAEILTAIARLALQRRKKWAILSDDRRNGYNTISRRAIYDGLYRWFPKLIPHFRQFYARRGRLFTVDFEEGRRMARDGDDEAFYSAEGCVQGDPMGRRPRRGSLPRDRWLSAPQCG